MSKRREFDYFGFANENKTRETIHESGLFFTRGRQGVVNGVVVNKYSSEVMELNVLDENGRIMNVPWKVFYFGPEDNRKQIEVILQDGTRKLYGYSRELKTIVEQKGYSYYL